MDLNFSVLQEPRGVMRLLQFVFCIFAFATTTDFAGHVSSECNSANVTVKDHLSLEYPFELVSSNDKCKLKIFGNFASDAKFFVTVGALSLIYCVVIMAVYLKMSDQYKTNRRYPLMDFAFTIIFAVLWLSSSAAWSNGVSGLKDITDPVIVMSEMAKKCENVKCTVSTGNFTSLNISLIFGFLNFFLWASDIWFVYKETHFFQDRPTTGP